MSRFNDLVSVTYIGGVPIGLSVVKKDTSSWDTSEGIIKKLGFANNIEFMDSFPGNFRKDSDILRVKKYRNTSVAYKKRTDYEKNNETISRFFWYVYSVDLCDDEDDSNMVLHYATNHVTENKPINLNELFDCSVYITTEQLESTRSYWGANMVAKNSYQRLCVDWSM